MDIWIRRIASLKLGVGLLVITLVALAAGTIVESSKGAESAHRAVYDALWFRVLLVLFCANVIASIVERWPWGRLRVGFLLTHTALVVILAGGVVSELFGIEGRMAIWEGQSVSAFALESGATRALPFAIRLDSFEIDTYPGTDRPAMFRSRVVVEDPARSGSTAAVIEMNHELAYGGWRFFQSSFEREPGRDRTVLSVARDPGQAVVFTGYVLLLAGMITVLATRIAQRRALAPATASSATATLRVARKVAALALAAAAGLSGARADSALPPEAVVAALRALPVQHDGRTMPLDTLARETVWQVTGQRSWNGADPVATVLGWTFAGDGWAVERMVVTGDFAAACGVQRENGRAAFLELIGNPCVLDALRRAHAAADEDKPVRGELADAGKLEGRMLALRGFLDGSSLRVVPPPGNPNGVWGTLPALARASDLEALLAGPRPPAWPAQGEIARELTYNRARPSRLAFVTLALAAALSIVAWWRASRPLDGIAVAGLTAGLVIMTWGIGVRWQIAGRIPASNMYESLLFLGWGTALFALAAFVVSRNRLVVLNATVMSAFTMALTDLLPIDGFIHPVPPVLAGTAWLAIHVPIIMLGYAVLALGVVVAHMQIGVGWLAPARRDLAHGMSDLLYWYIHVGAILLVAGILTGSIWASSSWGRYWGWDPKEVWSLVAFLAYIAILHGRLDRWLGPFGVAAASIVAFWMILMTYIGVNFVLAAGLHSYGFASSSVAVWFGAIALLEAAFLLASGFAQYSRPSTGSGLAPPLA